MKRHPYVACEFSDDLVIWRYFTWPKFMWLLEESRLFFCRMDRLKDKAELPATEIIAKSYRNTLEDFRKCLNISKMESFVNCWTISPHEESVMWDAYANDEMGVAIKTTVGNLIKCDLNENSGVDVGKVSYFDEQVESPQPPGERMNFLYLAFAKRKYYDRETELRLFRGVQDDQFSLPVDLKTMIQEVRINPSAPEYAKTLIRKYICSKGYSFPVLDSDL